jgi:hypothetical protein
LQGSGSALGLPRPTTAHFIPELLDLQETGVELHDSVNCMQATKQQVCRDLGRLTDVGMGAGVGVCRHMRGKVRYCSTQAARQAGMLSRARTGSARSTAGLACEASAAQLDILARADSFQVSACAAHTNATSTLTCGAVTSGVVVSGVRVGAGVCGGVVLAGTGVVVLGSPAVTVEGMVRKGVSCMQSSTCMQCHQGPNWMRCSLLCAL